MTTNTTERRSTPEIEFQAAGETWSINANGTFITMKTANGAPCIHAAPATQWSAEIQRAGNAALAAAQAAKQ